MYKQVPHEESARVPFYVRYPGVTPRHGKSEALFASIDIFPTVCGLAGVQVPEQLKGRNLAPVLRGKSMAESEVVFLMNVGAPDGSEGGPAANGGGPPPPEYRGLRSKTHTYAVARDGRWILFDNEKDPYQLQNLIDDPKQKPLVDHFNRLIAAWLKDADDPFDFAGSLGKRSALATV